MLRRFFFKFKQVWNSNEPRTRRVRSLLLTIGTSGVSRAVSVFCSLAQVPIAIRALGPEGFGLWMTLTSSVSLLAFTDLGMGNGIQNRVAIAHGNDDDAGIRRTYASGILLLGVIAVILFLLAMLVLPWINWPDLFGVHSDTLRASVTTALGLMIFGFCVGLPLSAVQKLLFGLQRGWLIGVSSLSVSVATLFLVIISSWMGAGILVFVGIISLVSPFVNFLTGIWVNHSCPSIKPTFKVLSILEMRSLAHLGSQFIVPQLGASILYAAPQVVISNALGVAAVTPFNLCQRIFGMFQQVQSLLLSPLWPAYAEAYERGDYRWVRTAFFTSFITSFVALAVSCGTCALMGPSLFALWIGKTSSLPPADLINWFALWTFLSGLGVPLAYLLNGLGKLRGVMIYGTINLVVSLISIIIVVRFWGTSGVVACLCVSYAIIVLPANCIDVLRILRASQKTANTHVLNDRPAA